MPSSPQAKRASSSLSSCSSSSDNKKKTTTTTQTTRTSPSDADPFALIERGNAMESSGNLWSASDSFGLASVALRNAARTVASEASKIENEKTHAPCSNKKALEKRRIAALYAEQSSVYLHRARRCLLSALEFETQEDEKRASSALGVDDVNVGPVGRRLKVLMERAEPLVGMLPAREARRRREIFGRIYAGGEEGDGIRDGKVAQKDERGAASDKSGGGAEEKKDDVPSVAKTKALASASASDPRKAPPSLDDADDIDAEMEAELLGEMDAEFGSTHSGNDDELDIPAAPSLPTLPKKGGDGGDYIIPAAPEDGAGHIQRGRGGGSAQRHQRRSADADDTTRSTDGHTQSNVEGGNIDMPEAPNPGEAERSLEERLAKFEKSLPAGIKSQDERLADIRKGLGRLGLRLPDEDERGSNSIGKVMGSHSLGKRMGVVPDGMPKSEEDQIREIIEMAADEARMEGHAVDPAAVAKAATATASVDDDAGVEVEVGLEGMDDLVISDDDNDLRAVLSKAGLASSSLRADVKKIEDVLVESDLEALREAKKAAAAGEGGGGLFEGDNGKYDGFKLTDRARALRLVSAAQELLFEATAFLEEDEDNAKDDDDDDNDDEEEEEEKDKDDDEADEEPADKEEGGAPEKTADKKVKMDKTKNKKKKSGGSRSNGSNGEALRKGREGLIRAQQCIEGALASLPSTASK